MSRTSRYSAAWRRSVQGSGGRRPPVRQAARQSRRDGVGEARPGPFLGQRQFLVPIHDDTGFEQERRHVRVAQHGKTVEIMHAIALVGKRAVFADLGVGVIERRLESRLDQRGTDRRRAGEAFFPAGVLGLSFVLAWLRDRSSAIWPCAVFHGFVNGYLPLEVFKSSSDLHASMTVSR